MAATLGPSSPTSRLAASSPTTHFLPRLVPHQLGRISIYIASPTTSPAFSRLSNPFSILTPLCSYNSQGKGRAHPNWTTGTQIQFCQQTSGTKQNHNAAAIHTQSATAQHPRRGRFLSKRHTPKIRRGQGIHHLFLDPVRLVHDDERQYPNCQKPPYTGRIFPEQLDGSTSRGPVLGGTKFGLAFASQE